MNIRAVLGVAGVSALENSQAKKVGRFFEKLVLASLVVVFVQLILSYTDIAIDFTWINHLVWVVFFLEFIVNLYLVDNRLRYAKQNWLNLFIVILAFPWIDWSNEWAIIIRTLRLLLLMRFFANFFQDVSNILSKNRFGQILIGFAFLVVGSGGVFMYIEERPFIDGVWYALVTITTVGYGDVVPQTENGRIFGAILIIFGVLFFSLVTANFSAFLVGSEQRKLEKEILSYVQNTEKRLTKLSTENERHVEYIMLHMSKELEQLKSELTDLRQKELQRLRYELDINRQASSVGEEGQASTQGATAVKGYDANQDYDSLLASKKRAEMTHNEPEESTEQQSVKNRSDNEAKDSKPPRTFKSFGFFHKGSKKS